MKWMTEMFTQKESSLQNNVPTSSLGVHRSKNSKFHHNSWKHTMGCWLFLSPLLPFAICWLSSTTKLYIKFSDSCSMVIGSLDDWITAYTKLWILKNPRILPGYVLCCWSLSTYSTKHQLYHDPSSPKSNVAWNMTGLCSRIILHDVWQVISVFPPRFRVIDQNSDSSRMNFIGNVVLSLRLT